MKKNPDDKPTIPVPLISNNASTAPYYQRRLETKKKKGHRCYCSTKHARVLHVSNIFSDAMFIRFVSDGRKKKKLKFEIEKINKGTELN